ncbi:hypothetical protein BC937DRAFT_92912 [Endogone sp. FLAS-F59071]|nr:hypothetical protein BC937DRAFT_92912 [Endogone sp. FLAS-F59071]|eukprot:RUS15090.1 hypothetical protein BC937DRAFT_92912 [Endogone sp. FLAS-F59071]
MEHNPQPETPTPPIRTPSPSNQSNREPSPTPSPSKHLNPIFAKWPLSNSPTRVSQIPLNYPDSGDEGGNADASSSTPATENPPANGASTGRPRRLIDKFNIDSGALKAFGMRDPFAPNPERQLTVETSALYDPSVFSDQRRPPQSDARSVRSFVDSTRSKKKKRPAINTSSTPAEIFAASLSDAVLDAEDSDENESFVYRDARDGHVSKNGSATNLLVNGPQYGYPHIPPTISAQDPNGAPFAEFISPGANQGISRSLKGQLPPYLPSRGGPSDNGSIKSLRKASNPGGLIDSSLDGYAAPHRPVLRSSVADTLRKGRSPTQGYGTTAYPYQDWYSQTDNELASLLRPLNINGNRRCGRLLLSLLVTLGLIIFLSLGAGVLSTYARPLTKVTLKEISNVLAAQRELIFDIHVCARNSNLWGVQITKGDLSVFASSQHVFNNTLEIEYVRKQDAEPAEFLGSVQYFDAPLLFKSGIQSGGSLSESTTQIHVKNPGLLSDDNSGNERWSQMLRYPYDLTIRGSLKYHLFPFYWKIYSVSVCDVASVDPDTGKVTSSPETQRKICEVD